MTSLFPTETLPCQICDNKNVNTLAVEQYSLNGISATLPIVKCTNCGLVWVNPRLTENARNLVYEEDAKNTISNSYCWEETSNTERFEALLKRLAGISKQGLFMDAGCGAGDLLQTARNFGEWQCVGLDPSPEAAKIAKEKSDITFHQCTLEEAPYKDGSVSIVCLLGVLEHVPYPLATLQAAHNLLGENGAVGIYVPNFNYLWIKDHGLFSLLRYRRWSTLHPQEHLFGYNKQTISLLLRKAGFEICRIDIGAPFYPKNRFKAAIKKLLFFLANTIKKIAGIHLGGFEIIAKKISSPPSGQTSQANLITNNEKCFDN